MKSKKEKLDAFKKEKIEQELYESLQNDKLNTIKANNKGFKRFIKVLWFYVKKPFIWIFDNIRDWRTALIFGIVFLVVSSEVWVFYILGFVFLGTDFGGWCLSIASACWAWWLLPIGSPFTLICISLTALIKAITNKIREKIYLKGDT